MVPSRRIYVAEVRCDPHVEAKINAKHSVTLAEVREAVIYVPGLRGSAVMRDGENRVLIVAPHPPDGC